MELDGTSDVNCPERDVAAVPSADVARLGNSRRRPPLHASASKSAGDKPGSMLQQGPGLLFPASAPCRRRYESVWVRNLKKWKTRYEEERSLALRRCGREGFGALPVMQRSGMMLGGGARSGALGWRRAF